MGQASKLGLLAGWGLLLVTAAVAQDWPQFRGDGSAKVTGFTVPETWPPALAKQWRVVVGAGDATPALVGDRLYVFARQGDDEITLCLNAADGATVWQDKVATPAAVGPAARHPGPRSSPAVGGGKVVTIGLTGVVSCLDAASGAVTWRKDPYPGSFPKFYTASSPLIINGLAVVQVGGPGNGGMIAYDLATGEEKWRWSKEGADYASPALLTAAGKQYVAALTEKSAVGVALADGALAWQLPFVPQGRAYNSSTPVVNGDTVYYAGSGRGLRAEKIAEVDGALKATELWANPDIACQFSAPVMADGFLYGMSDKGNLFCVEAATGKVAWTDPTQTDRGSYGCLVNAGKVILALPSTGELIVFKADPTALNVLARYKVAETPSTFAGPVLSGQRIFTRDQDSVTLWTLP